MLLPSCDAMNPHRPDPWAIILAGGDGLRLRSLTQKITGDPRPKQFCALLDGETMLDRTRRRADLLVRPDRQVAVVTNRHREYFGTLEPELAPGCLVVQPDNQGTVAGIVYPVMRIQHLAGRKSSVRRCASLMVSMPIDPLLRPVPPQPCRPFLPRVARSALVARWCFHVPSDVPSPH